MTISSPQTVNAKRRVQAYENLPPRHARGCPRNVLRAVEMQLAFTEVTPKELCDIIQALKDTLPCKCPKPASSGLK
jgi:hypothetical protein